MSTFHILRPADINYRASRSRLIFRFGSVIGGPLLAAAGLQIDAPRFAPLFAATVLVAAALSGLQLLSLVRGNALSLTPAGVRSLVGPLATRRAATWGDIKNVRPARRSPNGIILELRTGRKMLLIPGWYRDAAGHTPHDLEEIVRAKWAEARP